LADYAIYLAENAKSEGLFYENMLLSYYIMQHGLGFSPIPRTPLSFTRSHPLFGGKCHFFGGKNQD
jgi:hypothetical protein